jgi:hypothetical protein
VRWNLHCYVCPEEGARKKKKENAQKIGNKLLSVSFLIYSSVKGESRATKLQIS